MRVWMRAGRRSGAVGGGRDREDEWRPNAPTGRRRRPSAAWLNPLDLTDADLDAGGGIFSARCAGCHGADGAGAAPRWPSRLDTHVVLALDLTRTALRTRSDGAIYTAISPAPQPRACQPSPTLAETVRWQLVALCAAGAASRLRVRATDGGAGYRLGSAARFSAAQGAGRQPDEPGEGRARPPSLLRHAPVGRRHVLVRHLPRTAAGLHRRQAACGRPQRPDPSAQRDGARQRRLRPGADLGRPDRRGGSRRRRWCRCSAPTPWSWDSKAPSARCWPGWPPSRATRRCSRPLSRRADADHRRQRDQGHRRVRADAALGPFGVRPGSAPAPTRALVAGAARGEDLFFSERTSCFRCHGGFNFTERWTTSASGLPGIEFHNTGLYNLDPPAPIRRPTPASTRSPAGATTWAASGRRRCATSR